ncbi:MAG: thioesterase family protein [Acidimicrobiia bacterium]
MALYHRDGDRYVPTGSTRGPWDPTAQNGGPVSALAATAALRHDDAGAPAAGNHVLARLTVDLVRPAPLTPLTVATTTVRPGRKVQLVEVRILAGDDVVTRALALRMPAAHPDVAPSTDVPPPFPDDLAPDPLPPPVPGAELFHVDGAEVRARRAGEARPVPLPVWVRLRQEVIEGEETLPSALAAAASDFGSGITGVSPPGWRSINVDVDLHLVRPPRGPWVCYLAESHASSGVGLAGGPLYDREGRIGHALQSVLVEPWGGAFPPPRSPAP